MAFCGDTDTHSHPLPRHDLSKVLNTLEDFCFTGKLAEAVSPTATDLALAEDTISEQGCPSSTDRTKESLDWKPNGGIDGFAKYCQLYFSRGLNRAKGPENALVPTEPRLSIRSIRDLLPAALYTNSKTSHHPGSNLAGSAPNCTIRTH